MTPADLTTAVRRHGSTVVIDLVGDLDARAEPTLETAWQEAVAQSPDAVVLGFERTGYINSTGIALVVGLLAKARARRVPIRAFGLTAHYREIFEITRLTDFLAIEPDEHSAVAGAGRSST